MENYLSIGNTLDELKSIKLNDEIYILKFKNHLSDNVINILFSHGELLDRIGELESYGISNTIWYEFKKDIRRSIENE